MNWKPNLAILPRTQIRRYQKTGNVKEKLKDMEYRLKTSNMYLIGILERENKDNGEETVFIMIIVENYPNLILKMTLQIKAAQ